MSTLLVVARSARSRRGPDSVERVGAPAERSERMPADRVLPRLAEAALDARGAPDAVAHFLSRMQHEANRLARLVQELLDLSRLQGGEVPPDDQPVAVDAVVDEAVDRGRLVAEAKRIEIVRG